MTEEAWTCGKGIAASGALPEHLARLLAARAEVLERHTRALDLNEPNGRQEHAAYMDLVGRHRAVAAELQALADQMRAYRDLPMAAHDMDVMMAPDGQMAAFAEFVSIERGLAAFLADSLKAHAAMLGEAPDDHAAD